MIIRKDQAPADRGTDERTERLQYSDAGGLTQFDDIVHYPDVGKILYDEDGTWRLHRTDDGSLLKGGKIEQVRPLTWWGSRANQV